MAVEADDLSLNAPPAAILNTLLEISGDDLLKVICAVPSKCCMLDLVPTRLLKEPVVLQCLLPAMLRVVNTRLTAGVVPPCFLIMGVMTGCFP